VVASSPPGERVDAHGRRQRAPGQNQKDSQASGIGDTRRGHRRRSSERTKNAIAAVGEEGPAEVTKTAPSNKT
jgi:hypothetical protein